MNADQKNLLTNRIPDIYRVCYMTCPHRAEEVFSEAIFHFTERADVSPAKYAALISTPALTVATFRQLAHEALSAIWHEERRVESLDAQADDTQVSEIEWGTITRGSAVARQRGKRVHGSHVASDEETEVLIANLAKQSWGGLDALDVAAIVRESEVLRLWLSGYSGTEIRKPATVQRGIQALQNQI